MEEWFRKLKLLHWTCIERDDRTSPFVCFDDDGGDGGDGGDDDDDDDDDDDEIPDNTTQEFSAKEQQGAIELPTIDVTQGANAPDPGVGFGGEPGGTGVGSGSSSGPDTSEPENDFATLDNSAPSGYVDYGGAPGAAGAQSGQGLGDFITEGPPDLTSTAGPDPNAPAGPDVQVASVSATPGREDDKEPDKSGTPGGLNIYDQPMGPPNTKELEQQFEKEFQQQFEQPRDQPQPPAPSTLSNAVAAITNALVGTAQAAPISERVSQAPINPDVLKEGQVANPFGNLTDPNKDQAQVPQGNLWELPPSAASRGKEEEQQARDQWGPQTAINTFGFNPNSPPGYNFAGVPTAPSAPPIEQQVATNKSDQLAPTTGPNMVTTQSFQNPNVAQPFTPTPSNLAAKGSRDPSQNPFAPDRPDVWNPDYFAPPVGMVNLPSTPAPPGWAPSSTALQDWQSAQPFGPNMPTQASPQVAQAPPDPFGTPGGRLSGPTGPQTPFDIGPAPPAPPAQVAQAPQPTREQLDIMTNPTPYGPMTARQGTTPPAVASRAERERERPENRAPVVVTQAPPPSVRIDTGARNTPPWSDVPAPTVNAPPVEVAAPTPSAPRGGANVAIQDASGNTAVPAGYAPDQQAGNPLAGGLPLGATIAPPNFADFGGGTGPLTQPRQQARQVSEAERQLRRAAKANQDAQAKRDAIAFAMMNRPY